MDKGLDNILSICYNISINIKNNMLKSNLKELRKKAGCTQIELSEQIGVSRAYLSKIERGVLKNPNIINLLKLLKVFKCKLEDLYFFDKE